MKLKKYIVSVSVLLALLAGGVSAYAWFASLPDPENCSVDDFGCWLALRDLDDHPMATRVALVDRFEQIMVASDWKADFFESGDSGRADASAADSSVAGYTSQINKNLVLLQHAWFTSRVARFAALEPEARDAFLDRQLQMVGCMTSISVPGNGASDPTLDFFKHIDQWTSSAAPDDQAAMIHAVECGVVRWLATRDLMEAPESARHELARRIAFSLDAGLDLKKTVPADQIASLEEEESLFRHNSLLLAEAWVGDQAVLFEKTPDKERISFVDKLIDSVTQWQVLSFLANEPVAQGAPSGEAAKGNMTAAFIKFDGILQGWISRAEPVRQKALTRLATAIKMRCFFRQMNSVFGGSEV